jgi:lipopolysaccharide transport system permease protein
MFPLAFFSLMLAGTALGTLLTPIGMLYTDIGKIIPFILQATMYITPVIFAIPESGIVKTLFNYNPISSLIITARETITGFCPSHFISFGIVSIVMLFIFFIALLFYRISMPILIERMSS